MCSILRHDFILYRDISPTLSLESSNHYFEDRLWNKISRTERVKRTVGHLGKQVPYATKSCHNRTAQGHDKRQWRTKRGFVFQSPPSRNSEVFKKLNQISSSVENTPVRT
jgi:transcription antitermination factor NusG